MREKSAWGPLNPRSTTLLNGPAFSLNLEDNQQQTESTEWNDV